ncbi:GNAT family N-acetyltransferase [Nocardiopsis sp. NPDC049922]|uniref:GNAT family N-acetyltransferase n=1 Tax=Nocardiopsis sp. NPDC049922 TaxID=3155157 RepID=UPI0033EE1FDB
MAPVVAHRPVPRGRIRPTRPDELPRAAEPLAGVGTDITEDLHAAAGKADTSLLLHECLTQRDNESAMRAATGTLNGSQTDPLARLSALLVATDRDERAVGYALTIPPSRFLAQVRQANEVQGLALTLVITKLKGLAVDPAHRGRGIGAALVKRSVQVYEQSGFHVMYGQSTADRDLEPFYRRQRFTVLDLGEPLRLEPLLALPASIASEGEERFFHRLLG